MHVCVVSVCVTCASAMCNFCCLPVVVQSICELLNCADFISIRKRHHYVQTFSSPSVSIQYHSLFCCSALTLSVGQQEGHLSCKKFGVDLLFTRKNSC